VATLILLLTHWLLDQSGGAFAAPVTINYNGSNIGSNVLNSFASASANTTASITTGFGGSSTGPSMSVNNSYATGTLTLTSALANTVLYKSGSAVAVDEANVVMDPQLVQGLAMLIELQIQVQETRLPTLDQKPHLTVKTARYKLMMRW
jgi:hypothetical protein